MARTTRTWRFRLAASALAIALALALGEAGLRLAGYGFETRYFVKAAADGGAAWIENPKFVWRFIPPALARAPQPVVMPAKKAPNTCRIFVLGESAAMGDPEPAVGFPRILQVLLEARYPDRKFEVINAAMTAINSHVVLPLARECARHEGDVWFVYLGNNEVTGPFGPGTVFGGRATHLGMLRAGLALKTTKTGQWLDALGHRMGAGTATPKNWAGMEMFLDRQVRHDDPGLEVVHKNFRQNLADIIRAGRGGGAKVIVSTVASNLKDSAPFASRHAPGLSAAALGEWEKHVQAGKEFEAAGKLSQAVAAFERAAGIDGTHAELQFRLGRCRWEQLNYDEARRHFGLARDYDTLRFRADSELNEIIRAVAGDRTREGVRLVDAEKSFAVHTPKGITGDEFLWEHVHFKFQGNYLLAVLAAHEVAEILDGPRTAKGPEEWLPMNECTRRLAFTRWADYRLVETMRGRLSQPPFDRQINHPDRDQRLLAQMVALLPGTQRESFNRQADAYRQALEGATNDWVLHDQFGKFLEAFGDGKSAAREWRKVIELVPHHFMARLQLGNLLAAGPETAAEGEKYLREALAARPDTAEVHSILGLALARQKKYAEADAQFDRALHLRTNLVEAQVNWGLALIEQGKTNDALLKFNTALTVNSNNLIAHGELTKLLLKLGRKEDAEPHIREILRLDPKYRLPEKRESDPAAPAPKREE